MTATVTISNPESNPRYVFVTEQLYDDDGISTVCIPPGAEQSFTVYGAKTMFICEEDAAIQQEIPKDML